RKPVLSSRFSVDNARVPPAVAKASRPRTPRARLVNSHSGGSDGCRHRLFGQVENEAPALQLVVASVGTGFAPQAADVDRPVGLWLLHHLLRGLALLFDVSLDHLRRHARCQFAVFTALKQDTDDNVRIAAWREAHEPP